MAIPNLVKDKYGIGDPAKTETLRLQANAAASDAKSKAEIAKARSPFEIAKNTVLGLPKAALDVGKDVAKGAAEFALSAGEAPARIVSPKLSTKVMAPTKIPGLGFLGPVQSFESKAAQAVQDGATPGQAIAHGTLDTIVNDPLGMAVKPLAIAGGVAARLAAKSGARLDLKTLANIISRGKGAVAEAPAVAARADEQFAGMTLPERLAATDNTPRKLPVFGDTSLRPLPVEGSSATEKVPFANDYRTQPAIDAGPTPKRASDLPVIRADAPATKGELTYEPIPQDRVAAPGPLATVAERQVAPKAAQVARETAPTVGKATSDPVKLVENHLTEAKQVKENLPAADFAQLGGELALIEHTKTNIVDGLAAEGKKDVSEAVKALDTSNTKTLDEFTQQVEHIIGNEKTVSGVAKGVETRALNAKLTNRLGDLAGYDAVKIADQEAKVEKLPYADMRAMVAGTKEVPHGVHPMSVFTAVEQRALKEGDVETLRSLAKSPIATMGSEAGQTLRLIAERDPESPVAAINAVTKVREKVAEQRGIKNISKVVNDEVKAAKATIAKVPKEDWASFVDSITC